MLSLNIKGTFLIAFPLLFSVHSHAQSDTVQLCVEDHWYPYATKDGTGMSVEIVEAGFKAVNIEVEFAVRPYNRLIMEVKKGANYWLSELGMIDTIIPVFPSESNYFI